MSKTDNDDTDNVEIMHRVNRLKTKAGGDPNSDVKGHIDEEAIKDADKRITEFCNNCTTMVNDSLDVLLEAWEELKTTESKEKRGELAHDIFAKAHHIKDIAGTCGYVLISDFGESLRDYILETEINQDAHEKIIQAHIDVMSIAYKENIKDDGGSSAVELRKVLKQAMEKYS